MARSRAASSQGDRASLVLEPADLSQRLEVASKSQYMLGTALLVLVVLLWVAVSRTPSPRPVLAHLLPPPSRR